MKKLICAAAAAASMLATPAAATTEVVSHIMLDDRKPGHGSIHMYGFYLEPNVTYEVTVDSGDLTLVGWALQSELFYELDGIESFTNVEVYTPRLGRTTFGYAENFAFKIHLNATLENNVAKFRYTIDDDTTDCVPGFVACNYRLRTPMWFYEHIFWQVENSQGGLVYLTYGAPTPEPSAWALMIAGFGVVGSVARRRSRRERRAHQ